MTADQTSHITVKYKGRDLSSSDTEATLTYAISEAMLNEAQIWANRQRYKLTGKEMQFWLEQGMQARFVGRPGLCLCQMLRKWHYEGGEILPQQRSPPRGRPGMAPARLRRYDDGGIFSQWQAAPRRRPGIHRTPRRRVGGGAILPQR